MEEQDNHPQKRAEKKRLPLYRHPLIFAIAAGTPFFLIPTIGDYLRYGNPRWAIAIAVSLLVGLSAYQFMDRKNQKSNS